MKKSLLPLLFTLLSTSVFAVDNPAGQRLQAVLDKLNVGLGVSQLKPAPIAGFLEIVRGMQVLYVSDDGRLLIDGDILSIDDESNVTEQRRAQIRRDLLANLPPEQGISVFPRGKPLTKITVFVDTNCRYCMKLHKQADGLVAQGVQIEYLFYPRSGPASESFSQAVSIWCSEDRLAALDMAMRGSTLSESSCDNPVMQQYELAGQLELRGTPAIIFADGTIDYGAPDTDELLEKIRQTARR